MKQLSRYGMWLPGALALAACSAPEDAGEVAGEVRQTLPVGDTDYTPTSLTYVTVQQKSPYAGEGPEGLIDTSSATKLLVTRKRSWIQYRMPAPTVIRSYDITSANDVDSRDPKEWTFEGSFDGYRWVTLDSKSNPGPFPQRETTYGYTFSNTTPYLYYRLNITRNSATEGGDLQLAGLRVGGTRPSGTMPGTVGAVTVTSSGTSATVSWGAVSGATGYYVQRNGEDGQSIVESTTSGTSFVDSSLVPGGVYVYRVQAHNGGTLRGYPSGLSSTVKPTPPSGGLKDLTALTSFAPTDQYGSTGFEGAEKVTDAITTTKYLTYGAQATWLQQQTVSGAVVTQYTLTSANDFPNRDPKDFRLQGSNSASGPWTTLDTRTGQGFPARYQTRTYSANPSNLAFSYYRLVVDANNGAPDTQLAEWRLFGTASASLAAPVAPSGVTLNALSNNQILVNWTNNAGKLNAATQVNVERAPNSSFTAGQVTTKVEGAGSIEHRATALSGGTQYCFRVKAVNAAGASSASPSVCTTTLPAANPPTSFQEGGWYGGHNRTLNRRTLGSHAALYADEYVSPQNSGDWIAPLMDQAWGYTKTHYGSLGDPFVAIVLNMENVNPGDEYGGGGVQYVYDQPGYRNLAFSTSSNWADTSNDWILASLTHELGHIVESNTNGVFGSPTFGTWGDSKWAEVYQWDLYELLSASLPAGFKTRAFAELNGNTDDNGLYWFRDFWYPVYAGQVGNTATSQKGVAQLSRYFQLLAQYWPHQNTRYVGDVTLGEFIHFFSGAAGVSLEAQAKVAFRWNTDLAIQFATAQRMYPAVLALYSGGTCTPETDAAFCTRLGATCGTKTGADNCGTSRTVTSCGSCSSPQTCGGGGTPNMCGGGGGTNPCASLCASPQTFSGPSYQSGNLGNGATCHETLANLAGLNCGGFASGRTFRINDTLVSCSGSNVTLPAKRNGGYCMQASAGNESWAYFSSW